MFLTVTCGLAVHGERIVAFQLQQWLRERVTLLNCTYIVPLVAYLYSHPSCALLLLRPHACMFRSYWKGFCVLLICKPVSFVCLRPLDFYPTVIFYFSRSVIANCFVSLSLSRFNLSLTILSIRSHSNPRSCVNEWTNELMNQSVVQLITQRPFALFTERRRSRTTCCCLRFWTQCIL
jgi:hypothetical protein